MWRRININNYHSQLAEHIWCKGLDSHARTWWKKVYFNLKAKSKPLSPTFKCSLATFAIWAIAAISNFTDASVSQAIYPLKDIPGFCSTDAVTPSRSGKGVEEGAIYMEHRRNENTQQKPEPWKDDTTSKSHSNWHSCPEVGHSSDWTGHGSSRGREAFRRNEMTLRNGKCR